MTIDDVRADRKQRQSKRFLDDRLISAVGSKTAPVNYPSPVFRSSPLSCVHESPAAASIDHARTIRPRWVMSHLWLVVVFCLVIAVAGGFALMLLARPWP